MVQVYSEPLSRRHYSTLISLATTFRLGLFLIAVAISLVVAFVTGGFWVKMRTTADQPTVHYTHDALLLFEGALPGQEQVWSTSQVINEQFADYYVPATVEVAEDDFNFDGKPDVITLVAKVRAAQPVHGVKALVQFGYKFAGTVRMSMYSFAYVAATSPSGGGALFTDGELLLNQRNIITERVFNGAFDYPMLNFTSPLNVAAAQGSQLEFQSILRAYNARNLTTYYGNYDSVWRPGPGNTFELNMRVRIPTHQIVFIRPQWIEMLKFGWIQFIATFITVWYILWWFQWLMFRYRIIPTRVVSDVHSKPKRQ